jgi:putative protein kinase ArgK-like GTPase of G3E family
LVADLEEALHVRFKRRRAWEVPIVPVSAATGEGQERLLAALAAHEAWQTAHGLEQARMARRLEQVRQEVGERLTQALWLERGWRARAQDALRARRPPREVSSELLSGILGSVPGQGPEELPQRTR